MQVHVTSRALSQMHAAAAAAFPSEACGLMLGTRRCITEVRAAANIHPAPDAHFEIDPQALIDAHRAARAGGPEVIGYYHSHPTGPPEPSATDRACASGDGRVWAIIGEGDVKFWMDGEQGFAALSFTIVGG